MQCAQCPFARDLNDRNRFVCGFSDEVVRGHWQSTINCQEAIDKYTEASSSSADESNNVASVESNAASEPGNSIVSSPRVSKKPLTIKERIAYANFLLQTYRISHQQIDSDTWLIYVDRFTYRLTFGLTNNAWYITDRASYNPTSHKTIAECLIECERRSRQSLKFDRYCYPQV